MLFFFLLFRLKGTHKTGEKERNWKSKKQHTRDSVNAMVCAERWDDSENVQQDYYIFNYNVEPVNLFGESKNFCVGRIFLLLDFVLFVCHTLTHEMHFSGTKKNDELAGTWTRFCASDDTIHTDFGRSFRFGFFFVHSIAKFSFCNIVIYTHVFGDCQFQYIGLVRLLVGLWSNTDWWDDGARGTTSLFSWKWAKGNGDGWLMMGRTGGAS